MNLIRMNDRESRSHLSVFRKRVYCLQTKNGKKVIYRFSPQYQKIYQNYKKAIKKIYPFLGEEPWQLDNNDLTIIGPFLGINYNKFSKIKLNQIALYMQKVNTVGQKRGPLLTPRYINKLLKLHVEFNNFTHLKLLLKTLKGLKRVYGYGCGVDDPAWANFVFNRDEIFIVDLDNFNPSVNLDYELGFLLADAESDFKIRNTYSWNKLFGKIKYFTVITDYDQFLLGYISRMATLVFDYFNNEINRESALKSANEIELLCQEFNLVIWR